MNPRSVRPGSGDDAGHEPPVRSCAPPPVGTVEWEQAGGPPLSFGQRLSLLSGAAGVILWDLGPRLWWLLSQWGLLPARKPAKVDLAAWAPPDTRAAREAEKYLREVSIDHADGQP